MNNRDVFHYLKSSKFDVSRTPSIMVKFNNRSDLTLDQLLKSFTSYSPLRGGGGKG